MKSTIAFSVLYKVLYGMHFSNDYNSLSCSAILLLFTPHETLQQYHNEIHIVPSAKPQAA
jgi:hypothetical protein